MNTNVDTLAAAQQPVAAGFTEPHAEAIVRLVRDMQQGPRPPRLELAVIILGAMIFAAGFSVVTFGRLAAGTYCL